MEIVKVNYEEYGLEEKKAKQISDMFKPMLDKMVELEEQANEVLALPMGPETYAKARELRLEYKRTRTGTAAIHKDLKAFYLQGGRFVDGWKNSQLMAAQGMEEKLLAIENHEAEEAAKKAAALQEKRAKALAKFDVEVVPENLGELDTVMWSNYLTGTKVNFEKKKEEERLLYEKELQTEKDRKANEEKLALHNERILLASPYKSFIEGFEDIDWAGLSIKELKVILDNAKEADKVQKAEAERIRRENERLQAEADEREKKRLADEKLREEAAAKQRQEEEAKLKKEREARERTEKELKERQEEEERRVRAKEKDIQDALNADDSTKVNLLIEDLEEVAQKYTFKSDKNQEMYDNVGILIGKVITFIQK